MSYLNKPVKFLKIIRHRDYRSSLRFGVAAAVEHEPVLKAINCKTIIDIGANRGQFALAARHCCPLARIISFEPLPAPCEKFRKLFSTDENVRLHAAAIGRENKEATIYISRRDDSSSLLPITDLQETLFPGTGEKGTMTIPVHPLDQAVSPDEIVSPALLKLDVQGYELNALQGSAALLPLFDFIYAECSFVELYAAQPLAHEIIEYLDQQHFTLTGIYNLVYGKAEQPLQGDFLFSRMKGRIPSVQII